MIVILEKDNAEPVILLQNADSFMQSTSLELENLKSSKGRGKTLTKIFEESRVSVFLSLISVSDWCCRARKTGSSFTGHCI